MKKKSMGIYKPDEKSIIVTGGIADVFSGRYKECACEDIRAGQIGRDEKANIPFHTVCGGRLVVPKHRCTEPDRPCTICFNYR